jgi:hypothetical protein
MDDEKRKMMQDLMRQIQDKSVELADLEVILDDYRRERGEILREISRLKASLWELSSGAQPSSPTPRAHRAPAPELVD